MPDVEASGVPTQEDLLAEYCRLVGRPYPDPYWNFYKAFHDWRGVIITQSIAARLAAGQESSPQAKLFAKMFPVYIERCREAIALLKESVAPLSPVKVFGNITPSDEYCHRPDGQPENFNESVYLNWCDSHTRVGGFIRVGNRVHEGRAEVSVCIYDNGRVWFAYQRPEIRSNNGWCAAGLRVDVRTPFRHLLVRYDGESHHLTDPAALLNPKVALKSAPKGHVTLQLDFLGPGSVFGVKTDGGPEGEISASAWQSAASGQVTGASDTPDGSVGLKNFARNHIMQRVRVKGNIRAGDKTIPVDAHGMRDHSWGPRYWQSIQSYRFFTANFGSVLGFTASIIGTEVYGTLSIGDEMRPLSMSSVVSQYNDGSDRWWEGIDRPKDVQYRHTVFVLSVGCGDAVRLVLRGTVIGFVPLRNRRNGEFTSIGEGLTHYTLESVEGPLAATALKVGQEGYGMSEFLNQGLESHL